MEKVKEDYVLRVYGGCQRHCKYRRSGKMNSRTRTAQKTKQRVDREEDGKRDVTANNVSVQYFNLWVSSHSRDKQSRKVNDLGGREGLLIYRFLCLLPCDLIVNLPHDFNEYILDSGAYGQESGGCGELCTLP